MSRDELTGEISAKQITHKFVEQHDDDVRELTVSNGLIKTVIITSDEHPFYVFSKGFTATSELKTNDQLVSLDYQILKVVSNKRIDESMLMYNFEVADYHTYAVSEQNVWVHNDCLPVTEPRVSDANGLTYKSNPKHTPGQSGSRPNAGIEPKNSFELFESSIVTSNRRTRLSIDNNGHIHRFQSDPNGQWHWNGSTGDTKVPMTRNRELKKYNNEFKELTKDQKYRGG